MLTEYVTAALKHAEYKRLSGDEWFGEVPLTPGVWATGTTIEETREELRSVLEDWIMIGLRKGETLPAIDGIKLDVHRVV